jgi:hypothetical protein
VGVSAEWLAKGGRVEEGELQGCADTSLTESLKALLKKEKVLLSLLSLPTMP